MKPSSAIARLERHRAYLRERVQIEGLSEGARGHMQAELAALDWAIPILEDLATRQSAEARNVHRQRVESGWRMVAYRALGALMHVAPEDAERIMCDAPPEVLASLLKRSPADKTLPVEQPAAQVR